MYLFKLLVQVFKSRLSDGPPGRGRRGTGILVGGVALQLGKAPSWLSLVQVSSEPEEMMT